MRAVFKDCELQKLRGRAKYDDNNHKWQVPAFYVKEREVVLPRIRNAQAFVQDQLDKRELVFEDEAEYEQLVRQKLASGANASRNSNRGLTEPRAGEVRQSKATVDKSEKSTP